MKSLIIDTSSEYCILAIADEDSILEYIFFLHENRLSHSLLHSISSLLDKAKCSLREIQRIAVGVGPGSYTGTRIGVSVARSFAYALAIPLRGFCSLLTFLPPLSGRFASILPAKGGLFYLLKGEKRSNTIQLSYAQLITKAVLDQELREVDFITAKTDQDVIFPQSFELFSPYPDPANIAYALQEPPIFPFERHAQLIYLHSPS